jgi:hypothetical protein
MKSIATIILICTVSLLSAQNMQKTTVEHLLKELALKQNLELSYSADLVNLKDSIKNYSVNNIDSCLVYIENETMLHLSLKDHFLVISPHENILLTGVVIDSETKEPLPYANILIKDLGVGTITNKNGEFNFNVWDYAVGKQITFSFIGYNNSYLDIKNGSQQNLHIKMVPKRYELESVTVVPQKAREILEKAVKNIKRTYHRRPVQMEAFYRNTNYRDTIATQLIEAALLIDDKGISKSSSTTKIKLQEIRKSKNYQVQMDKKHEIARKVMENYFGGHQNLFYKAYGNNIVRKYKDSWWYKPLTDYQNFKYEFEGAMWLDSVKVYKIKFIYDKLWINGKRASESTKFEDAGYIYVNASDFGILKVEQWWKFLGKDSIFNKPGGALSKKEVVYQKNNGKYYMKYERSYACPNGAFRAVEKNSNGVGEKVQQWAEQVLLITNINANRKEFDKIRYRDKLSEHENTYKTIYDYHPEFWKKFNVLKQNPVEEHLINQLEWESTLDEQFKENSSNAGN